MSAKNSQKTIVDILLEFSIPLISGVVVALIWANVRPESFAHFLHWSPFGHDSHLNFHFLINDIFMVFFFGIATKEITESCLPGGALNPIKKAINPILGTIGGVLGPILVYLLYIKITGASEIAKGWAIPTATDIALAWLVARLAFGKGHPAIAFLLLLAIADDGIGLIIIAIFYPDPLHPVKPVFLLLVLLGMAVVFFLRKKNVKSFWPYLLSGGVLSWWGLFLSHVHPALALVPIIPFLPAEKKDEGLFEEEAHYLEHTEHDTLNAFEHFFKKIVDFGLFGFGLANAGVSFSSIGHATWAVFLSLLIGKSCGVWLLSYLGTKIGFSLPEGMNKFTLFLAALTAGIGMTVALFVAGVAFTDPIIQGSAKMGALMSVFIAIPIFVLARLCSVKESNTTSAGQN